MNRSGNIVTTPDLTDYWSDFGYKKFGTCFSDHLKFTYVPIPKNASSYVTSKLLTLGWQENNFSDNATAFENSKFLVILRDPIDRWLSGINQYFLLYHKDLKQLSEDALDLISTKIVFDDHTEKQIYYCNNLNLDQTVFFKFGPNLNASLTDFLSKYYCNTVFDYTTKNSYVTTIQHQFRKRLDTGMQDKLYRFYWQDYELINKVTFYNA